MNNSSEGKSNSIRLKLPRAIWALGIVSLLMDVSSETIHGLMPSYLVNVLGASIATVGLIDGVGAATVMIFKFLAGPISDFLRNRKVLVVLGYGLASVSKPFFALAGSSSQIFLAHLFDRVGKGIRGAPRDALITELVPREQLGAAFGLRQALDSVGAFIGPMMAIALMYAFAQDYRAVFWCATIPSVMAVLVLVVFVREPKKPKIAATLVLRWSLLSQFSVKFWLVVSFGALIQLLGFSEVFLILRLRTLGLADALNPLVLITINLVYAIFAYPAGRISDRLRRESVLFIALLVLAFAHALLAFDVGLVSGFLGLSAWGVYLGLSQGVITAMVADQAPKELVGTAFGVFNAALALAVLIGSPLIGWTWEVIGPRWVFATGAVAAIFSALALWIFLRGSEAGNPTSPRS